MTEREPADLADDMRWLLGIIQGVAIALGIMSLLRLMLALSDGWWPAMWHLAAAVSAGWFAWCARRRAARYEGLSVTFHFPSRGIHITRERP